MLLLYRNRVGWFQHKTTPTFGGPPGESGQLGDPCVFRGGSGKRGVSPTWGSLPFFFVIFHGNPWLWELGYQFMRNKLLFFFGSGHFSWEAFCLGADDCIMWCQPLPKKGQSSEVMQNWLPKKLWGNDGEMMGTHLFGTVLQIYFWGFGASSILFQRFFDETMRQIWTNSHIICRYIISTAYRLVHCLKTADQVYPRKPTVDTQNK